jgi:sugar phosphate isomerase/epimerase
MANCLVPLKKGSLAGWPIVGATSQLIRSSKWYKDATQLGVDAIEINRRHSKLHLNVYFLEKVKQYLQDLPVSLHSATTGVFQKLESFTQAELATLQAEIDVARFLGAHEIIFHLNSGALDESRKRRLAQVVDYGKENGVELIYESDSVLRAHDTCKVLETFPAVGYALDLGHLNNGYRRNLLGCEIEEFISRVRDRTVYIHANNNCGTIDEHKGLNDGSLNWRWVMDLLDICRIRKIIIEVHSIEYLKDSQDALRDYLADREHRTVSLNRCCERDSPVVCSALDAAPTT